MSKSNLAHMVVAGILSACALLPGCKEYKTQYSNVKKEEAIVTNMNHTDAWMQPIVTRAGKATSFRYINHPEKNEIEFDGEVDFRVDNKNIYNRFKKGEKAIVEYVDVFRLVYDDTNNDGKKELIETRLVGHELKDAYPRNLEAIN